MAAVAGEGGPPADIKATCKKVQVVKGYALDPQEPHIIITYREDWRDPSQKDPATGKALTRFSEPKTKRVKLSTFKANSPIDKFALAAQKNAESLIPDINKILPLLRQLAERLGGPPASAGSAPPTPAPGAQPAAAAGRAVTSAGPVVVTPKVQPPLFAPAPATAAAPPPTPLPAAPVAPPQPRILTPVVIRGEQPQPAQPTPAPVVTVKGQTVPVASPPAATTNTTAAVPAKVATQPITSPPAKSAPAKAGQPLNVDEDDDDDLSSMTPLGASTPAAAAAPAKAAPPTPTPAAAPPTLAAAAAPIGSPPQSAGTLKEAKEEKPKKKKPIEDKKKKKLPPPPPMEKAYMRDVEQYIEKLYEGVEAKIKGTAMLLQLVQKPEHLDYFVQSESTLNTLSRVLNEDMKRSTILVTNILEIFFCFSSFTQLHHILINNKIGDATIRIIDMEIKRYEGKYTEDGKGAEKSDIRKDPARLEKQERLLFVCFYILLNLAEDTSIEIKMKKRKIVPHLCRMLKRKNKDRKFLDELHLLIITFLKKLSIFTENKEEMVKSGIMEKLRPFLRTDNEELLEAVLRLLFNLSFDAPLRAAIANMEWLRDFVACLDRVNCRLAAMKLLYNLSADDHLRPAVEVAMLSVMPLLNSLVIRCQSKYIEQELAALTINVTVASAQCVEAFSAGDGLFHLIKRVHQTLDPLGMKLIRNMSQQPVTHKLLMRHGHELVGMAMQSPSPEFLVEALGTLNNIQISDCGYADWISKGDFLNFLLKHLIPGVGGDDDIVLEVIMLLGTMALDPRSGAILVSRAHHLRLIYETLIDKRDDVEIVLQTMFTLYRYLMQDHTREAVIKHEKLALCMLDLVVDPHPEIRNLANQALDIIMEHDRSWRDRIRDKRFEACNAEWLDFIAHNTASMGSPAHDMRGRSHTPATPGSQDDYDDYDQRYALGGRRDPAGRSLFEDNHDMRDLDDDDSMEPRAAPPGMGYDSMHGRAPMPRTPESPSESMSPR